jgi:hypothetical protein
MYKIMLKYSHRFEGVFANWIKAYRINKLRDK